MYSSKETHKLCGAKFLTGPYVDSHKISVSDRFKGKQFLTKFPKQGNASVPGVLFSRFSNEKVKTDPYDVGNNYLKSHPPGDRKLGFGSHDAPKKDEFMSGQRAEQHKHTMRIGETIDRQNLLKRGSVEEQIQALESKVAEIDGQYDGFDTSQRDANDYVGQVPRNLYSIGRSDQGSTPVFLKDSRDHFYSRKRCQQMNKPRHVSKFATTSGDFGRPAVVKGIMDKISIPGVPKGTKQGNFFDAGHLSVNNHHDD